MGDLSPRATGASQRRVEAVLDTSVWMAIFNDEPAASRLGAVMEMRLVTTPVVLAELTAHARMGRVRGSQPAEDVERKARLEPLTRDDAIGGAEVYARLRKRGRSKVSLADALIYATAQRAGALLVTLDSDLAGEPGVLVPGRARA